MTVFNGERLEGIHRWHEWFRTCLAPERNVQDCAWEIEGGKVIWCIDFQDGSRVCVHVNERALRLDETRFDTLVDQLEEQSWQEVLVGGELDGIRIHPDGRLERFDTEDFDR